MENATHFETHKQKHNFKMKTEEYFINFVQILCQFHFGWNDLKEPQKNKKRDFQTKCNGNQRECYTHILERGRKWERERRRKTEGKRESRKDVRSETDERWRECLYFLGEIRLHFIMSKIVEETRTHFTEYRENMMKRSFSR